MCSLKHTLTERHTHLNPHSLQQALTQALVQASSTWISVRPDVVDSTPQHPSPPATVRKKTEKETILKKMYDNKRPTANDWIGTPGVCGSSTAVPAVEFMV